MNAAVPTARHRGDKLLGADAADCYPLDAERGAALRGGARPRLDSTGRVRDPSTRGLAGEALRLSAPVASDDYARLAADIPHPDYADYARCAGRADDLGGPDVGCAGRRDPRRVPRARGRRGRAVSRRSVFGLASPLRASQRGELRRALTPARGSAVSTGLLRYWVSRFRSPRRTTPPRRPRPRRSSAPTSRPCW